MLGWWLTRRALSDLCAKTGGATCSKHGSLLGRGGRAGGNACWCLEIREREGREKTRRATISVRISGVKNGHRGSHRTGCILFTFDTAEGLWSRWAQNFVCRVRAFVRRVLSFVRECLPGTIEVFLFPDGMLNKINNVRLFAASNGLSLSHVTGRFDTENGRAD